VLVQPCGQCRLYVRPIVHREAVGLLICLYTLDPCPTLGADVPLDELPVEPAELHFEVTVVMAAEAYDVAHVAVGDAVGLRDDSLL
jgi:hypothetical protein